VDVLLAALLSDLFAGVGDDKRAKRGPEVEQGAGRIVNDWPKLS
jgi:hypothetical protein